MYFQEEIGGKGGAVFKPDRSTEETEIELRELLWVVTRLQSPSEQGPSMGPLFRLQDRWVIIPRGNRLAVVVCNGMYNLNSE